MTNSYRNIYQQELQSIVKQIISNSHPEKIILFGSGADSSNSDPGDIDLLIIKNLSAPRLRRRSVVFKDVVYHVPVDALILTPEEINTLISENSIFINEILTKGKVLYDKEKSLV